MGSRGEERADGRHRATALHARSPMLTRGSSSNWTESVMIWLLNAVTSIAVG